MSGFAACSGTGTYCVCPPRFTSKKRSVIPRLLQGRAHLFRGAHGLPVDLLNHVARPEFPPAPRRRSDRPTGPPLLASRAASRAGMRGPESTARRRRRACRAPCAPPPPPPPDCAVSRAELAEFHVNLLLGAVSRDRQRSRPCRAPLPPRCSAARSDRSRSCR